MEDGDGRGGGSWEGSGDSGAGSKEGEGGGGGDEDVLPVHNWRQQGRTQYLCEAREGGCMEWRSARTALRLSLHSDCFQHDRLSTLCVHGRDSEQVCTQHLHAHCVECNNCLGEGQDIKVSAGSFLGLCRMLINNVFGESGLLFSMKSRTVAASMGVG